MEQFRALDKLSERMCTLLDSMEFQERTEFLGVLFFMITLRLEKGIEIDEEGFNHMVQTTLKGLDGEYNGK